MIADKIKDISLEETDENGLTAMETEPKPYEIGYLLTPLLPEEEAGKAVVLMRAAIESRGGMIVSEGIPEMRRLAYPINKQNSAYFGWMKFIIKPEGAVEIQKNFRAESKMVRFLLIVDDARERKILKPQGAGIRRPVARPKGPEAGTKESLPVDNAEVDKRIEELLGETPREKVLV